MDHPVVHFEIPGDDLEKLKEFYTTLFGWKIEAIPGLPHYMMVIPTAEGGPGIDGGLSRRTEEGPATTNTISVPSIDDYVARIQEAGGKVVTPKMPIPGVGWLAYFEDPEGNKLGIMQEDPSAG